MLFILDLPLCTFLAYSSCAILPVLFLKRAPTLALKTVLPPSLSNHFSNFLSFLPYSCIFLVYSDSLSTLATFVYHFQLLLPLLPFSKSFDPFLTSLRLVPAFLLMLLFCLLMVVVFPPPYSMPA